MSSWVIASNPATYDADRFLQEHGQVDWVAKNNFECGDIVYVYEVIPPRGRGGIIYETEVVRVNLTLSNKLDDRTYWAGQRYPKDITEHTKFIRLKLIGESHTEGLSLVELRRHGFTPPQGLGHLLDKKPSLLSYIQSQFSARKLI